MEGGYGLQDDAPKAGFQLSQLSGPNLRRRSFSPLLERAGLLQITFDDLRHTCASLLFQNVHPKFVQGLPAHASVAITLDTYSHTLPDMGDEAAHALGEALG
jgi:integrase